MARAARAADRDASLADLAREAVLDRIDNRLQDRAAMMSRQLSSTTLSAIGPKRTRSMSRYSSIAASSSRSGTKCSGSAAAGGAVSLTINTRAVSGLDRINEEIEVSVLNRKCGLIDWRAPRRGHQQLLLLGEPVLDAGAVPILIGIATQSTLVRITSRIRPGALCARRRFSSETAADLPAGSSRTGAMTRTTCQSSVNLRMSRRADCRSLVQKNGENVRSRPDTLPWSPPANPQPMATERRRSSVEDGVRHGGAAQRAGVRAGDETGEKRSRQREIGGVVVEDQPGHDAGDEGTPSRRRIPAAQASRWPVRGWREIGGTATIVARMAATATAR